MPVIYLLFVGIILFIYVVIIRYVVIRSYMNMVNEDSVRDSFYQEEIQRIQLESENIRDEIAVLEQS